MAVVKNLMVRVGADLSGFSAGMSKAGNTAGNFAKRTRQAMQESAASMSQLKDAMAQGGQNKGIISLTDRIKEIEAEQKALQSMGFSWGYEGFEGNEALLKDLKSQLQEYINSLNTPVDGPEQWIAQLRELQGAQSGLKNTTAEFKANASTMETLNTKVREWTAGLQKSVDASMPLGAQLSAAKNAMKEMEAAGLTVGDGPWDEMYQEVARLTQAVNEYKASLTQADANTGGLGSRLKSMFSGTASGLKSMATGTVSGLKSIGSRLLDIGRNARSSTSGADKLGSALKKIGLTAVALKLVSAVTGRLRFIVSNYISENAVLQSQVDSLKSSLGQALAPAINLIINALSTLMPYIVGVSNAIGSLITNLFGKRWTTVASGAKAAAAATGSAAAAQEAYNRSLAGFDEITKLDSNSSSGGGGGGGSSSTSTALDGTLPEWLSDLGGRIQAAIDADNWEGVGAAVADKLGEAVDKARSKLNDAAFVNKVKSFADKAASVINGFFTEMTYSDETSQSIATNTGAMIGDAVSLGLSTAHQFLTGVNFGNIGKAIAQGINGALSSLSKSDTSLGTVIADLINAGIGNARGFVKNLDWSKLGRTIVQNIKDLIKNIDYSELTSGMGSLLGGIGMAIWTVISDEITNVKDYFAKSIEDAGGSIGEGILNGIKKALLNGVTWLLDNALIPFVKGVADQFDGTWLGDKLDIAVGALGNASVSLKGKVAELDTTKVDGSSVSAIAKYTKAQDSLSANQKTLSVAAKLFEVKTSALSSNQRTISTTAKFTSVNTSALSSSQRTLSTTANFTGVNTSALSSSQRTLSTTANFTGVNTSALSSNQRTVSTTANFTGVNTSALSSSQKTLSVAANLSDVKKGWTGSLEKKLGIDTLSAKLNVKTPTITAKTASVKVTGLTYTYPSGFDIKWNAKGVILNGAQLFGRAGNTLLGGGEAGREALLPLDSHTGWMDKIADRVALRVMNGQSGDANITIQLVLDGKIITQTVVRNINAQARATGHNPLAATM